MRESQLRLSLLAPILVLSACSNTGEGKTFLVTPSLSRAAEIRTQTGLGPFGASFVAMTRVEVTALGGDEYHFALTFPTTSTAEIGLKILRGRTFTPDSAVRATEGDSVPPIHGVRFTADSSAGEYRLHLEYFVPDSVLSQSPSPSQAGVLPFPLLSLLRLAVPQEGGKSESQIIVDMAVKDAGKSVLQAFQKSVEEGVLGEGTEGTFLEGVGAVTEIVEAAETGAEIDDLGEKLNEAERLARNPENALTQKEYDDNPGLQQAILDDIKLARAELSMSTVGQFMNKEIAVASSLTEFPPLIFAVGVIANWNDRALKQSIKERIANILKRVSTGRLAGPSRVLPPTSQPIEPEIPEVPEPAQKKLPPGTWRITYATTSTVITEAGTLTGTDNGAFIFHVSPDGSLKGTGSGRFTYHGEGQGSVATGGTGYTFGMGGAADDGLDFWIVPEETPNIEFVVVITGKNGSRTQTHAVSGPMLFKPPPELKLVDGSTASLTMQVGPTRYTSVMTVSN